MKEIIKAFGTMELNFLPPKVRCVYGLFNNKKLVYIGSTNNLAKRLLSHIDKKSFNAYCYVIVPKEVKLENVEVELIKLHKPILNNNVPTNDIYIGWSVIKNTYFLKRQSTTRRFMAMYGITPAFTINTYSYYERKVIDKHLKHQEQMRTLI